MRVNANSDIPGHTAIQAARTKAQKPAPEKDQLALDGTQHLKKTLAQVPEVRAEKVAQARQRINDPSYPSDAVLGKIANVLGDKIQPHKDAQ